jgi:hypothetical protein
VREIRTPRSVGTGGGRPPPVTRWASSNGRPYREHNPAVPVFPKAYVMQKIRAKVSALFSWPAVVPAFTDHHSSGNLFFMVSIRVSMTRSRLS